MRKLLIAGVFGVAVVGSGGLYAGGPATLLNAGVGPHSQTRLAQAVDQDDDDDEDIQPDIAPSPDDQDNQDDQGDPQADDGDDEGAAAQPIAIKT